MCNAAALAKLNVNVFYGNKGGWSCPGGTSSGCLRCCLRTLPVSTDEFDRVLLAESGLEANARIESCLMVLSPQPDFCADLARRIVNAIETEAELVWVE